MTRAVKFAEHSDRIGRTFGQTSDKSSLGRTLYEGSANCLVGSVAARLARGSGDGVARSLAEVSHYACLGRRFVQVSADLGRRLGQESDLAVERIGFADQALRAPPRALRSRPSAPILCACRFAASSLRSTACGLFSARHAGQGALAARRPVRAWPRQTPFAPCPSPIPASVLPMAALRARWSAQAFALRAPHSPGPHCVRLRPLCGHLHSPSPWSPRTSGCGTGANGVMTAGSHARTGRFSEGNRPRTPVHFERPKTNAALRQREKEEAR